MDTASAAVSRRSNGCPMETLYIRDVYQFALGGQGWESSRVTFVEHNGSNQALIQSNGAYPRRAGQFLAVQIVDLTVLHKIVHGDVVHIHLGAGAKPHLVVSLTIKEMPGDPYDPGNLAFFCKKENFGYDKSHS
mgnify:CR=1 FL=1